MVARSDLEIKRLKRLKKGQIINVVHAGQVRKAKVINNFKNARIIDIKINNSWLFFVGGTSESKEYEWPGFTITLKEDLM